MTNSNDLRSPSERDYVIEHIAIGADVRVSETTLVGDQSVPWHWHSQTADIFFCLEGRMLIQIKGEDAGVELAVGERYTVDAGIEHRVQSTDGGKCRFILVQGVGKADFKRSCQPQGMSVA